MRIMLVKRALVKVQEDASKHFIREKQASLGFL
jgi:hypothetical protein